MLGDLFPVQCPSSLGRHGSELALLGQIVQS